MLNQAVVTHNPRVIFDGGLPEALCGALGSAPVAALPHLVGVAVEGVPETERVVLIKLLMGEGLQAVTLPDPAAPSAGDRPGPLPVVGERLPVVGERLLVVGERRRMIRIARRPPPGPPSTAALLEAMAEALEASTRRHRVLCHARGRLLLEPPPLVMGVLNVTPDSFFDGGRYASLDDARRQADVMIEAGAAIIDIGGESTRPGAETISPAEEWRRVGPLIEALAGRTDVPLSIDTRKAEIARRAIEAGAAIVNDVTLLSDPSMVETVADRGAALIIGHIRGEPRTMQDDPHYREVVADVIGELRKKVAVALRGGLSQDTILCDPGIGFGKSVADNLRILARVAEFKSMGLGLVLGCSRKSFLGHILGRSLEERLSGTTATTVLGALARIEVIRVHDVPAALDAIRVVQAVHEHASPTTE